VGLKTLVSANFGQKLLLLILLEQEIGDPSNTSFYDIEEAEKYL
jgi:hypothetical protein